MDLGQYGLIGISIPFMTSAEPALRLAGEIKKISPSSHLTLGGNYVSASLSKICDASFFDCVDSLISGDGEIPLEKLIGFISSGGSMRDVPGAIWREDGNIIRNTAARGVSLVDLPVADVFPPSDYPFTDIGGSARTRLTKGCSWGRCAFCGITGGGLVPFERPDEEKMFEKIAKYVNMGKTDLVFSDEEANYDMLERFANRVIESGLKFRWSINIRLDPRIDLKWANLLAKSGCWSLLTGIESYNDRLLRLMNKGTDSSLIDRCLEEISWSGINVVAYMMVGLPTETEEEARDSFARVTSHMDCGNLSYAWYSRYYISERSPIHINPERYGVRRYSIPKERDLAFYSNDFEHEGMKKDTAQRLYNEFVSELNHKYNGLKSARREPCLVSWNGCAVEVGPR
jgi:radical SAM superfamily enzyme YgiQ (UPF0313 family)